MQITDKIKVGFVPCLANLYNKLFQPENIAALKQFATDIPSKINSDMIDFQVGDISSTTEQISLQIDNLTASGCDMIVMLLAPYCPSGAVAPAVMGSNVPVLLWAAQTVYGFEPDTFDNSQVRLSHGVHAVQDIANILRKRHKPFGIIHGHYLEEGFCSEFEQWSTAARIYTSFVNSNPIQIGGYFKDMLDLQISNTKFVQDSKISNTIYDIEQLYDRMQLVNNDDIARLANQYRQDFDIAEDVDEQMLLATARGELAVRSLMGDVGSKACGINFQTLCNDKRVGDAMHVASCRLMAEGKGYAGEGDWVTAAFVYAMQSAVGIASFSEIFSVDYKNSRTLIKHWGEANTQMARKKCRIVRSAFNEINKAEFCVIDMEFMPGEVTLINLNATPCGNGQLISIYGDITSDSLPKISGARALFKPRASNINRLLDDYAYNGGSHHLVLVKGNVENMLAKLAKLTGWSYMSL